jgi:hypothetical protein
MISSWVQMGREALQTPEMISSIQNAFKNDGCMVEIRSDSRKLQFLNQSFNDLTPIVKRLNIGEEDKDHSKIFDDNDDDLDDESNESNYAKDSGLDDNNDDNDDDGDHAEDRRPDRAFNSPKKQYRCYICKIMTNNGYFVAFIPYCTDCYFAMPEDYVFEA